MASCGPCHRFARLAGGGGRFGSLPLIFIVHKKTEQTPKENGFRKLSIDLIGHSFFLSTSLKAETFAFLNYDGNDDDDNDDDINNNDNKQQAWWDMVISLALQK